MERKWKEHYMRLTKERVKAEKSLKKCQAELKETRQVCRINNKSIKERIFHPVSLGQLEDKKLL